MRGIRSSQGTTRRGFLMTTAALGIAGSVWPALGTFAQDAPPQPGGTLKIGVSGGSASDSLDPLLMAATPTRLLAKQWGDTLTMMGPDRQAKGLLAETFEADDTLKVWTFQLRSGVKFHDGRQLTADDVRLTYLRHAEPQSKSAVLTLFQDVEAIEAAGLTLVVRLKSPNPDLPYILSDYHLPIQPGGGQDDPNAAIGTGPYRLIEATPGSRYILEKNTSDWNPDRGFYDHVEILVLNDGTLRTAALQSGAVHMINGVDPKIAGMLAQQSDFVVASTPSRYHYFWPAMGDRAPFDNKDLILALKYAVDREDILEKILGGYGQIGNDIPVNAAYPLYQSSIPQRPFDLEKAAQHYKASGHDGSPIVLCCAENAVFPGAMDMAMLYQASCRQAGIPLEIRRVPDDGYWSETWLHDPFITNYNLGRAVIDQQYSMFYKSGANWSATHFANEEFDRLLAEARSIPDPATRAELYEKAGRILHDEAPLIIPVFADIINAYSGTVKGWVPNPDDDFMGGYAPSQTWFAAA